MMNLLCMTKYQILRILRKKVWISLLITGIIITLACFYYPFIVNEAPIAIMSQTVFGQAMLTLSFMMMGIELRREDSQEHIDDLATTYLKYTEKQPWSQIMVICALAIGVTVLLCVGCLIPLLLDGAPLNWILQTMAQIALVFFLPCLILGIWGMVAQLAIPGKNVYLPAVVLWLLTSSLTIYFTEVLGEHYEQWRLISGAFCMGFNNYQMYQNVVTGMKNEIPRWVMRSLCAFFIAAGYILVYKQKCISTKRQKIGRKIRNGAIAIMAVVLMASMLIRYSEFFTAFADDTYTQKIVYEKGAVYQLGDNVSLEDWPTEKNISLKKTDIRISCTTQGIQADVLITATADKTIENQTFTLFSDFEIDEVRVDEKTATFERSNDGIMVYFPDTKQAGATMEIYFVYHGYSLPTSPVNESTVQLNRGFAWIPWPGLKVVSENEIDNYGLSELFYISDWQRGENVEYTLEYDGPQNIYTNLKQVGENLYSGKSENGVTIYSGMLHEEYSGIDVYYPSSMYKYATIMADAVLADYAVIREFCEEWEVPILPEKPNTVSVVQVSYPMWGRVLFRPNELYSWGSDWEIRMRNESSSVLTGYGKDWLSEKEMLLRTVIPYLLNPCSGFPIDAPSSATHCFADLMAMSIIASEWDEFTMQSYMEMFKEAYFYDDSDAVYGELQIVFSAMGEEQFSDCLKIIYNRLINSEQITPEEIITFLLSDQEVKNEH